MRIIAFIRASLFVSLGGLCFRSTGVPQEDQKGRAVQLTGGELFVVEKGAECNDDGKKRPMIW